MSKQLRCPICDKPTSNYYGNPNKYGLCIQHAKLFNSGKIFIDSHNRIREKETGNILAKLNPTKKTIINKNIEKNVVYESEQLEEKTITENYENIIIDKGIKCLTCGYEIDDKLFCKKCYAKYHNKEIIIKIKNCREIAPLDDFYEGYFECRDGHVVKSMAEREIDNYLFRNNIKHGYETPLPLIDDNGKKITLHPDFCIFDEKGNPLYYIEYWGYDDTNRDYTKTKKFKMPLYKNHGITLINVNAKYDIRTLETNLEFKIKNHKIGISNFEDE